MYTNSMLKYCKKVVKKACNLRRNNKKLFRVQFVSYLCYTVHLLLLGAVTGGISYILNTLRSFCLGSKSDFLK